MPLATDLAVKIIQASTADIQDGANARINFTPNYATSRFAADLRLPYTPTVDPATAVATFAVQDVLGATDSTLANDLELLLIQAEAATVNAAFVDQVEITVNHDAANRTFTASVVLPYPATFDAATGNTTYTVPEIFEP
ncbi:MAG: hypothetical protein HC910_21535 [Spirulinaceae cyanobacterium SM2_1_0]|nr:hypothetical protein [Spirulinaceae cyanobacterium SM2_1_0]